MLHPHRSLQDLVDGELSDRRRVSVEHHVARCASCQETVARLRALKSALLGLQKPAPHPGLRLRLLAQDFSAPLAGERSTIEALQPRIPPFPGVRAGSSTGAADRSFGEPATGQGSDADGRFHGGQDSVGVHRSVGGSSHHGGTHDAARRRRSLVGAAGGSAVVVTVLLSSAYVVGSQASPTPVEAASGTTALRAGWESVAPQTPALLDTEQLDILRAGGWYCPELESLGFTLTSAEGITVAGRPTLELVLENDGETVTVYEQRKVSESGAADGPPVDAVTGRTVTAAGFEHVGGTDRDVWVRSGTPWQVVLDSPSVTYTVVSTLPAAAMPGTLNQLVTTEHAQLSLAPQAEDDSMMSRIVRGLSMITDPDASR